MAPTSSEFFNSKLKGPILQIIEDLGPSPLGSNPIRASSLESNPVISTPPVLVPPKAGPNLLSKPKLIRVASQPIPLRTLITLLNYERVKSDWRYENLSLYHSSEMQSRGIEESDTVYTEGARCFCYDDSPYPPDQQIWRQTTCRVHPEAPPGTRQLSSAQLERAFYESRSAEWGPMCELMYQLFFKFCGKDQQLKIQISDEQPVLVDASRMYVLHFASIHPRHRNLNGEHQTPDGVFHTLMLGSCEGSVLVFPPPIKNMDLSSNGEESHIEFEDCFVVDMLHMRYGKKGLFEEPYFLGSGRQWESFMLANVCASLIYCGVEQPSLTENREECSVQMWDWFYEHSLRAFHRWIANDQNPNFLWCDYCGIGGARFVRCCGEGDEMIRYCSEEHRQRGWALHRFTCKNKAEDK
ncbi:uncharacterized protein Bfra_008248ia [Botrytis fragariae]|uniref:MYND-type domain-containing protein n=1 Tax=Botrytis fragariae TaxID=1964551 RepID=A0A8H6EIC9_9HELO|nr:uncharacterized protein Bfra_008248ia [Botrytis fragariae]KAF5872970.1 hypothetical protein Bfra_008248ia [Botrytis fragariae]